MAVAKVSLFLPSGLLPVLTPWPERSTTVLKDVIRTRTETQMVEETRTRTVTETRTRMVGDPPMEEEYTVMYDEEYTVMVERDVQVQYTDGQEERTCVSEVWKRSIVRYAAIVGRPLGDIPLDGLVSHEVSDQVNKLDREAATVSAWIEAHAPAAPVLVRSEAMIRMAGWLDDVQGAERGTGIGDLKIMPAPLNAGFAARHSGAQALLAPWRVRTAVICEDDS